MHFEKGLAILYHFLILEERSIQDLFEEHKTKYGKLFLMLNFFDDLIN